MNETSSYAGNLLSLKDHVYYFILVDPDTGKALGKLIYPGRNKHYRVSNSTAAHLLYLLSRPRHAEITFDQMKDLVVQKYGISEADAESELTTFLRKLDSLFNYQGAIFGVLDKKSQGSVTEEPDPCGLFSKTAMWDQNPDIVLGDPPIVRDNIFFCSGNAASSIWR
jgi:hypothetical protein